MEVRINNNQHTIISLKLIFMERRLPEHCFLLLSIFKIRYWKPQRPHVWVVIIPRSRGNKKIFLESTIIIRDKEGGLSWCSYSTKGEDGEVVRGKLKCCQGLDNLIRCHFPFMWTQLGRWDRRGGDPISDIIVNGSPSHSNFRNKFRSYLCVGWSVYRT